MPKITEAARLEVRNSILTSAWKCFSRKGFHVTSMDDVVHQFYAELTGLFTTLTQRWISAGYLPEGSDLTALPSLFVTLMPGMIVMSHHYELPAAETLLLGMTDLASATEPRADRR
jgi:hypothetical protein